jgi:hypothetical protein
MNDDGSKPVKVLPNPIIELGSVSRDGEWVIVRVAAPGVEVPRRAVMGYPIRDGDPVMICDNSCPVGWSPDGKFFYISFSDMSEAGMTWKTALIPVGAGRALPNLPRSGLNSPADLAGVAGVKLIQIGALPSSSFGVFTPGHNPSTYAFTRTTVHRNLYRISVP